MYVISHNAVDIVLIYNSTIHIQLGHMHDLLNDNILFYSMHTSVKLHSIIYKS